MPKIRSSPSVSSRSRLSAVARVSSQLNPGRSGVPLPSTGTKEMPWELTPTPCTWLASQPGAWSASRTTSLTADHHSSASCSISVPDRVARERCRAAAETGFSSWSNTIALQTVVPRSIPTRSDRAPTPTSHSPRSRASSWSTKGTVRCHDGGTSSLIIMQYRCCAPAVIARSAALISSLLREYQPRLG